MSTPHPLPPKKDVALALLQGPSLFIHLDPRKPEVVVPSYFKKQPQLVLQVGLNMAIPIPDLKVDNDGVSCTPGPSPPARRELGRPANQKRKSLPSLRRSKTREPPRSIESPRGGRARPPHRPSSPTAASRANGSFRRTCASSNSRGPRSNANERAIPNSRLGASHARRSSRSRFRPTVAPAGFVDPAASHAGRHLHHGGGLAQRDQWNGRAVLDWARRLRGHRRVYSGDHCLAPARELERDRRSRSPVFRPFLVSRPAQRRGGGFGRLSFRAFGGSAEPALARGLPGHRDPRLRGDLTAGDRERP